MGLTSSQVLEHHLAILEDFHCFDSGAMDRNNGH